MSTPVLPNHPGLAPTFKRAAIIWWAWLWRSLLLGLGGSIFISLVVGISGILNHASDTAGRAIAMGLAIIVSVPLGIWAFQMVLEKSFREFTIRLVPRVSQELEIPSEQQRQSEPGEGEGITTGS